MNKREDNIFDLLHNEEFVQWVTTPSDELDHYWSNWMSADAGRQRQVDIARSIILTANRKLLRLPDKDYSQMLNNLVEHYQKPKTKTLPIFVWASVAAAAVFALVSILIAFQMNGRSDSGMVALQEYQTKSTSLGQKMTIKLSDGTMVKLNAGSQLEAPKHFTGDIREVRLTGEAYFEVTRDESRPFIIELDGMRVQVLGTSFVIKEDEYSNSQIVAVNSGKVSVSKPDGEMIYLVRDEMSIIDSSGRLKKEDITNKEAVFGWTENKLVFDEESFDQVINYLVSWYGVDFTVKAEIDSNVKYTASYNNPTVEEVLISLTHVYNFKYQKNGIHITIE
ncbi:MAG: FecR domain-containing protein [Marinoscillum sp.]